MPWGRRCRHRLLFSHGVSLPRIRLTCWLTILGIGLMATARANQTHQPTEPSPTTEASRANGTTSSSSQSDSGVLARPTVWSRSTPETSLPPLALPTPTDWAALPHGVPISGPLQPVILAPSTTGESATLTAATISGTSGPAGTDWTDSALPPPLPFSWFSAEYLLWWPRVAPLPPLALAGRTATETPLPHLGSAHARLLLGELNAESQRTPGGRLTYGFRLNEEGTHALSASYLFLSGQTREAWLSGPKSSDSSWQGRALTRPVVDALSAQEVGLPVVLPGAREGQLRVATSSRLVGWEIHAHWNLAQSSTTRWNWLVGYRYLQLHEGLSIAQSTRPVTDLTQWPGFQVANIPLLPGGFLYDEFQSQHQFHGGQIGCQLDWIHGALFLEVSGKLAVGQATNIVATYGETRGLNGEFLRPYGVLVQPSNRQRTVNSSLGFVPEAGLRLGFHFQRDSRLYLGYNFLYLSEVTRPGDQIDRTLDWADGLGTTPAVWSPRDRPTPLFQRSDFWIQGLTFGLEWRY